jgi:tRNA-specific 2-thiouridylase
VGRSRNENKQLVKSVDKDKDILLKHTQMPGPDVVLTGTATPENIQTAALICAGYTKSKLGEKASIQVTQKKEEKILCVKTIAATDFKDLMIY